MHFYTPLLNRLDKIGLRRRRILLFDGSKRRKDSDGRDLSDSMVEYLDVEQEMMTRTARKVW